MTKIRKLSAVAVFAILAFVAGTAQASELTLARIFSDGAVLQRNMEVPVWGTAQPGSEVEVSFAGQVKKTTAEADGRWLLRLDPMQASSTPAVMTVSTIHHSPLTINNVVIGEVWLCGGQSNMQSMMYPHADNPDNDPKKDRPPGSPKAVARHNEIYNANDSLLRLFKVEPAYSPFEESEIIPSPRGWLKNTPGETEFFTAVGYYFGKELRRELNVPIGLISSSHGGTWVEAWIPKAGFKQVSGGMEFYEKEVSRWRVKADEWNKENGQKDYELQKTRTERGKTAPFNNHYIPGTCYNAMIHPLIPYAMKGLIYYQGESNRARRNDTYREGLTALINTWRERWGQDKLYFFWAQIANWKDPTDVPLEKDPWGWAEIMNQQREVLDLVPDSGMAVLNDIGHHRSIHPPNKTDVGKRLSLWALNRCYDKDVVPSGPLFKSARKDGNKVIITFKYSGSGLMTGRKVNMEPTLETDEPLRHFQICGRDRAWKWAEAKITGKDTVEVWHPEVSNPVEVRYAWAANPSTANLYNKEGLPASLFKAELK